MSKDITEAAKAAHTEPADISHINLLVVHTKLGPLRFASTITEGDAESGLFAATPPAYHPVISDCLHLAVDVEIGDKVAIARNGAQLLIDLVALSPEIIGTVLAHPQTRAAVMYAQTLPIAPDPAPEPVAPVIGEGN